MAWEGNIKLVAEADRIRLALGLHPQLAHERRSELALFESILPTARYVGEIGLDGGQEYKHSWPDQIHVFERILSACEAAGGRVMSIHSRRATGPVLDHISKHRRAGLPILYWYSGGQKELKRAIELGCWFSVGPSMLASDKGRSLIERMPKERVLTETDGPFGILAGKPLFPWDVHIAIDELANIWRLRQDATEDLLHDNLRRLSTTTFP